MVGIQYILVAGKQPKKFKCTRCHSPNIDCISYKEEDRFLERRMTGPAANVTMVKVKKKYIYSKCKCEFEVIEYYQLTTGTSAQFDLEDQQIKINRQKYGLDSE
ncbi:unnamed protein product [Commensalibacter communis]|uniref:Uncharacterized protein n=1 Tax=Commensalibacter communis TaxID=2972786 RepID=A0A9W4TNT4_9PROT|nr:hypothetical protein [Commensalibacter communis]CAI3936054.1 unnamed protein product [Commensalibacter communis]CAI3942393.1 unnamed protein product [Commensalibacter communis]CAI3942414.1 unnamed protein product [Commensalibacter communis]CAI3944283.1 unnamed protein product [Commensalibacter communis]CAI3947423.1 unnamed protein product [Commensalibacter communis]